MDKPIKRKFLLIGLITCLVSMVICFLFIGTNTSKKAYAEEITLTSSDVFFSTDVKAGTSLSTGGLYSLEYTLRVKATAQSYISSLNFKLVGEASDYRLSKSNYSQSDGVLNGNFYDYKVIVKGSVDDIYADVQLQVTVTYGSKTMSLISTKVNLIKRWSEVRDTDEYFGQFTRTAELKVDQFIKARSTGFIEEVIGLKNYYEKYDSSNTIEVTSLVFRFPITNFSSLCLSWSTFYKSYYYYAKIEMASDLIIYANVYKYFDANTDDSGITTVSTYSTATTYAAGDKIYDTVKGQKLFSAVRFFAYDGYYYFAVKDTSMIDEYMPQQPSRYFYAKNSSNADILEANTSTIIYDDYNKELERQISSLQSEVNRLNTQITEMEKLKTNHANMEAELKQAIIDRDYANQQMEVMREEYQKKIDQLIGENADKEPSDDVTEEKPTDTEKEDKSYTPTQIALMALGGIFLLGFVIFCIVASRRFRK